MRFAAFATDYDETLADPGGRSARRRGPLQTARPAARRGRARRPGHHQASFRAAALRGHVWQRQIDRGEGIRRTPHRRQCCILDPEGDWVEFDRTVLIGEARRAPTVHEVVHALSLPQEQLVVKLVAVRNDDRPRYFAALLPRVQELRASTGRPHWLVVDEAHPFLPTLAQQFLTT